MSETRILRYVWKELLRDSCCAAMCYIKKADPERFEPSTAGLGGRCPIPTRLRVRVSVFGAWCKHFDLWGRADSNCRPSVPNARGWTKLPYYPSATFNERLTIKSCSRGPVSYTHLTLPT